MAPKARWGFAEWNELVLKPEAAARELYRRLRNTLSAEQQRAVMAWIPDLRELIASFAAVPSEAPLRGVPYALKDLFDLTGTPTRAGSDFLPEVRPAGERDSAIVQALRQAGAVCAAKVHLHEFACGNTGENPHYGDCLHPLHPERLTGGSSSGSVAAVAAGIVPLAVGSDTGGSIRGPASFCGLYGLRLQTRDPWIADAVPLAASCDTAGFFTASADDMLTTVGVLLGSHVIGRELNGVYLEYGTLDDEVATACRRVATSLAPAADSETSAALLDAFRGSDQTYTTVTGREVADVHRDWLDRFKDRYSDAVWKRIDQGRHLAREEILRAEGHRDLVRSTWANFFLTFDFLILPAVPLPALTKAQCTPENRRRMLELSAPATLGGLPVLTVPVSLPSGLTAGLQIVINSRQSPAIPWVLNRVADDPVGR